MSLLKFEDFSKYFYVYAQSHVLETTILNLFEENQSVISSDSRATHFGITIHLPGFHLTGIKIKVGESYFPTSISLTEESKRDEALEIELNFPKCFPFMEIYFPINLNHYVKTILVSQRAPNSEGNWILCFSQFEIYGELKS